MSTWKEQASIADVNPLPVEIINRAEPFQTLPHFVIGGMLWTIYLNFLLNPASPNKPKPRSSIVAGSGT